MITQENRMKISELILNPSYYCGSELCWLMSTTQQSKLRCTTWGHLREPFEFCRIHFFLRGRSQTMFTKFGFFWPPTPLRLHFLWYESLQKVDFFDHLPPCSCKHSLWTPPNIDLIMHYVELHGFFHSPKIVYLEALLYTLFISFIPWCYLNTLAWPNIISDMMAWCWKIYIPVSICIIAQTRNTY